MRSVDELYSIAKFLSDRYSLTDSIYTARRRSPVIRPFYRIQQVPGGTIQIGTRGYIDRNTWMIWYFGINERDTRVRIDDLRSALQTRRNIDGYLENFNYPSPIITGNTDGGGTLNGNVEIAVTGLRDSVEGLISASKSITVNLPNESVLIQIPKVPTSFAQFESYNIYARLVSTSAFALQANVVHVTTTLGIAQQYTLLSYGAGAAPPDGDSIVAQRFGTIKIQDIDWDLIEDETEDGVWDGQISLLTESSGLIDSDSADENNFIITQVSVNSVPILGNNISLDIPVVVP